MAGDASPAASDILSAESDASPTVGDALFTTSDASLTAGDALSTASDASPVAGDVLSAAGDASPGANSNSSITDAVPAASEYSTSGDGGEAACLRGCEIFSGEFMPTVIKESPKWR
jgi:hypothetical protein